MHFKLLGRKLKILSQWNEDSEFLINTHDKLLVAQPGPNKCVFLNYSLHM